MKLIFLKRMAMAGLAAAAGTAAQAQQNSYAANRLLELEPLPLRRVLKPPQQAWLTP